MGRRLWVDRFRRIEKRVFDIEGSFRDALGKALKDLTANYDSDFHALHVAALNDKLRDDLAAPILAGDFDKDKKLIEVKWEVENRIRAKFLGLLTGIGLFIQVLFFSDVATAQVAVGSEPKVVPVAEVIRLNNLIQIKLYPPFLNSRRGDRESQSCNAYLQCPAEIIALAKAAAVKLDCTVEITKEECPKNPPKKEGDCDYIEKVLLEPDTPLKTEETYIFIIPELTDLSNHVVKRAARILSPRSFSLKTMRDNPYLLVAVSDAPLKACVDELAPECSAEYEVEIGRGKEKIEAHVIRTTRSSNTVHLTLDKRLRHGDKVSVKTTDSGGRTSGSITVGRSGAKSESDAAVYLSLALERNIKASNKTVGVFDFKYDGVARSELSRLWSTPALDVRLDWDNREKGSEKKLDIDLNWSRRYFNSTGPLRAWLVKLGPGLEFDDQFENRNMTTSVLARIEDTRWMKRLKFYPEFGIELGRNMGLAAKIDPTGQIEDFDIARAVGGFKVSYFKELSPANPIESLSLGVSNTTRYLLSDEIQRRVLVGARDDGEDLTISLEDDGFKLFWQAEAVLNFGEGLGFSLKYEAGERPPFYLDSSKISAALVYSF